MSEKTEAMIVWILAIVLIVLVAYAVYTSVYDAAFNRGVYAGAFAICVTDVEEDPNGYMVVIRLEDETWLHYCYK